MDLPDRRQPGPQSAPVLAAPAPGRSGVVRCPRGRARRVPLEPPMDARTRVRTERARRPSTRGVESSALRPTDGDRASRDRRVELRGHRVFTWRRNWHRQVAADARPAGVASGTPTREETMTALSCAAVIELLEAFYDGELPVDRQIAVSSHLDHCESCGAALAGFQSLGSLLRAEAPGRV